MEKILNDKKYEATIKKLQRTENILVNATRVASAIFLLMLFPLKLARQTGEIIIDYPGISPIISFLLIALCYMLELFLYSKLIQPQLANPMTVECDPEKYLALNAALSRPRELIRVCAIAFLFMGDFEMTIKHANNAIADKSYRYYIPGLYHKARAQFLLGNYDAFKKTVEKYHERLNDTSIKPKARLMYSDITVMLELLCAIADNDTDKITELKDKVKTAENSKASEVFTRYIKMAIC